MPDISTRQRLIESAVRVFHAKGYSGAGVAEVLADAAAPKGSLYHHFPNGKADLAEAAARWAGGEMAGLIEATFAAAPDWRSGVETLCARLAKLFDISDDENGCPVSGILLDGAQPPHLRRLAGEIYEMWIERSAAQLERLGAPAPRETAETMLIAIQGAWVLARARGDGAALRSLPARFLGGPS